MTTTTQSSGVDSFEPCVLCPTKHHRDRPSFCQCKHCSIPLCFDCMKEHHEELLQDVEQISHQYNELQQLVKAKQTMIINDTTKSIEDANRYFESYINELCETQQKIIAQMEREKQHAQEYVRKLDADLRSVGDEIQGLAKEGIVQVTKMKTVSTELKKLEQQLDTYQIFRTENLVYTQPDLLIKFNCSSDEIEIPCPMETTVNETSQAVSKKPSLETNTLNVQHPPAIVQDCPIHHPRKDKFHPYKSIDFLKVNEEEKDDGDDSDADDSHVETSYNIDRMASDGKNILYTSYYDRKPDLIAYCLMDNSNDEADKYRDWNQSRIVDMIWWSSIEKFVCATKNAVYTVDHTNRQFKIARIIGEKWSYVRVAANTDQLFVWKNSDEDDFTGIGVYSTKFTLIKTIDFDADEIGSFIDDSVSFCVTDHFIVSICTRLQNDNDVFQVTFCDLDMNKTRTVLLGRYNNNIEVRTDGDDRFFITTGHRRYYIVSPNGKKQIINLRNKANYIAVLNGERIAVNNQCSSIEICTY